ncbi:MAG: hypothetical protein HQM11_00125 [SAR324 cluster bacterium]|nr:hypothetical protein [SAR324 cluster bacterium]
MMYETVFEKFAKNNLRYVVIGGIAVNFHGFSRATSDLDILMVLSDEEIRKFISIVTELAYSPRQHIALSDLLNPEKRREWIEEKNMKVFSLIRHNNPMETIDLMIHCPLEFESIYERRLLMPFRQIEIPVASIPDLIELKKWAGRERDLIDIKALKKIQELQHDPS